MDKIKPHKRPNYEATYNAAKQDPHTFWGEAANEIDWFEPPKSTLFQEETKTVWYPGGVTNTCYNAIDRHVESGNGDKVALIFESAMISIRRKYTYSEIQQSVSKLAGAMAREGVAKGDRVLIYMSMVPEAIFAMLACARIGAVHSVVFGGFAEGEVAKRIDDAKPKLILATSCGIEPSRTVDYKQILDEALRRARHKIQRLIVLQRDAQKCKLTNDYEISWQEFIAGASPAPCVAMPSEAPLYILYTSGTTGTPKGVVRETAGHMSALIWSMKHVYDASPDEVFWAASDIGWVVGHSYIVYAPLLIGATTLVFEGKPIGTPDAKSFWRVIEKNSVSNLFCAPTAIRAIKREDPGGCGIQEFDLTSLKRLFLAGERADPDTVEWAAQHLKRPVIDHWWQTELGWPALSICCGLDAASPKWGSAGQPVPGFDVRILDAEGKECDDDSSGEIVIKLPLPPGCFPTLWNNMDGYKQTYLSDFEGFYSTGDTGFRDEDGYIYVMSRKDDLIQVAGHRLSTGGMEQIVTEHPDIAECAVIGVKDNLKGQVPLALLVLNATSNKTVEEIRADLVESVRRQIGAIAVFKNVAVVTGLPKTRSGKILRKTLRAIANGEEYEIPGTLENVSALQEAERVLATFG